MPLSAVPYVPGADAVGFTPAPPTVEQTKIESEPAGVEVVTSYKNANETEI